MKSVTRVTGTTAASAIETDRQLCAESSEAVRTLSSTQTLVAQESRTETTMITRPETMLTARPLHASHSTINGQCHRYSEYEMPPMNTIGAVEVSFDGPKRPAAE